MVYYREDGVPKEMHRDMFDGDWSDWGLAERISSPFFLVGAIGLGAYRLLTEKEA